MEVISFKEKLGSEEYKQALLALLETQGREILIDKVEMKELIHQDPVFFLDLVRVYCFKSAQVNRHYTTEFLFNAVGEALSKDNDYSLFLEVEGLKDVDVERDYSDFSLDTTFEDMIKSASSSLYEDNFDKPKPKAKEKAKEVKEIAKNMSATYKIHSEYKGEIKNVETLYYLGAYTEDKMLKELPDYFPAGALDFSSLLRELQLSKQNLLLNSNDPSAIAAYVKIVGDTDANARFREQIQKDSIGLRDKRYAQILADIDADVVEHWHHYSHPERGGLTYEEQGHDNEQSYAIMLNNMADPHEKALAVEIVKHMNVLYKANHSKFSVKPKKID